MRTDIVSAEEARKLLDAYSEPAAGRPLTLNCAGDTAMFRAAPALARTVVALSEERDRLLRDFTGTDATGWEQEEKDHAAFLLAENRGGGVVMCPTCGRGSFVDGEADIDLSPRVCFSCEMTGLREREAATNAWLTEVGHLTLATAGVELAYLREREACLTRILACERGEWAPEGWKWRRVRNETWIDDFADDGVMAWCRGRGTRVVRSSQSGRWMAWALIPGLRNSWDGWADDQHTPFALEAIEAADKAAGVRDG